MVLALGTRFGETDWWGKAPNWAQQPAQKTIQVDVDEEILGCTKPTDLTVLADAGLFIEALCTAVEARRGRINVEKRKAYLAGIAESRRQQQEKLSKHLADPDSRFITAQVPRACDRLFKDDTTREDTSVLDAVREDAEDFRRSVSRGGATCRWAGG